MRKELRVGPANPAITLADIKTYDFVKNDSRDSEITIFIPVATSKIENETGRALVDQEFDIWYDRDEFWQMIQNGFAYLSTLNVTSIDAIKTYALDGSETVIDSSTYRLADNKAKFDQVLPSENTRNMDAVKIEVTAGYGTDDTSVPDSLKAGIAFMIKHYLAFKGNINNETMIHIPNTVKEFIAPYKSTINWFN